MEIQEQQPASQLSQFHENIFKQHEQSPIKTTKSNKDENDLLYLGDFKFKVIPNEFQTPDDCESSIASSNYNSSNKLMQQNLHQIWENYDKQEQSQLSQSQCTTNNIFTNWQLFQQPSTESDSTIQNQFQFQQSKPQQPAQQSQQFPSSSTNSGNLTYLNNNNNNFGVNTNQNNSTNTNNNNSSSNNNNNFVNQSNNQQNQQSNTDLDCNSWGFNQIPPCFDVYNNDYYYSQGFNQNSFSNIQEYFRKNQSGNDLDNSMTPYKYYLQEEGEKLMLLNPELSDSEIIEMLGNKWLYDLTEQQKLEYKQLFEKKFKNSYNDSNLNNFSEINFQNYNDYIAYINGANASNASPNCANNNNSLLSNSNNNQLMQKENMNSANDSQASNKFKLKYKSAFKLFKLANVIELKEQYPNLDCRQRTQMLKMKWKNLSSEMKLQYVKLSRMEKLKALNIVQKEDNVIY